MDTTRWIGCPAGTASNPIARMFPAAPASAARVPRAAAVASLPAVAVQVAPAAASVALVARSLREAVVASAGAAVAGPAARIAAEPVAPSRRTPRHTWPARSRLPTTDESNVDYS